MCLNNITKSEDLEKRYASFLENEGIPVKVEDYNDLRKND